MPRVLISDSMDPRAAEIFRANGVEADEKPGLSKDELKAIIGDYDGLAIRSATRVTAELLDAAPGLRVVGRAGIGVDNVDIPAATARGVVVMNTPFGNSITTAEHAVALMFALARELPAADLSTQAGKWEKNRFMGVELTSKTLGLIGCGNIGSAEHDLARMTREAYGDFHHPAVAPLTEQTRNVLSRENLARTKRGVRIVNCARGGLIDEAALRDALESGHVAGAALDVFVEEPATDNILFGTPGLIATPHLGASTTEAQVNVAIQVAEQMSELLITGGVTNALNVPSLSADEAPRLRPYMLLAEMLGSLVGQLAHGGLTRISIETEGHAAALNQKPITAAVLAGLMRVYSDSVNMVNAPFLARERGIDVREVRHDREGDYHTLVRVSVDTEGGERSVAGTLFGDVQPRLVELFGIPVEAELNGEMIYIVNEDKPGFIGRLGTVLGEADINIATFNLGRRGNGGEAVCLAAVDGQIPPDIVQAIGKITGVKRAAPLRF